jgi:hypothetical protein
MKTIKLTQADIDANPLLKKIGAVAGQSMEYSFVTSGKTTSNETNEEDDDTGGSNPGNKPKPDKP